MWGGRFAAGPAAIMQQINASIDIDRRLYAEDIAGSKAHADMLVKQGILTAADGAAIAQGLDRIKAEIDAGDFERVGVGGPATLRQIDVDLGGVESQVAAVRRREVRGELVFAGGENEPDADIVEAAVTDQPAERGLAVAAADCEGRVIVDAASGDDAGAPTDERFKVGVAGGTIGGSCGGRPQQA